MREMAKLSYNIYNENHENLGLDIKSEGNKIKKEGRIIFYVIIQ